MTHVPHPSCVVALKRKQKRASGTLGAERSSLCWQENTRPQNAMMRKGPVSQCICDRFIVGRCTGLPAPSTDMTFKSPAHSLCSVGLPHRQPCETRGTFSPSAKTPWPQVQNVTARFREHGRVCGNAACFDAGGLPANREEGALPCAQKNGMSEGFKGSCPISSL